MTTYNTGNPIGSTNVKDLYDNTENLDYLAGSTTLESYNDRLGVPRKTWHGMEVEFLDRLLKMAFTPFGTFTTGATLTDARQTLLWEVSQGGDGHYYSWGGSFPKVVSTGSSPSPIEAGSWVDRTDDYLREELTQNGTSVDDLSKLNTVDGAGKVKESGGQSIEEYLQDLPNKTPVLAQRPSFNALPRLLTALSNYDESTNNSLNIVGLGSSVGVGASLPDPATQSPVKYLGEKLKSALDIGNIFNINSYNYSVNGSTISEYSAPLEQSVTDGYIPKLLVLAYGMNDSGVAIFNSGQTYPQIYRYASSLIQRARDLGSDVIIMTTPHHKCSEITYYMPSGIPQVYPTYVAPDVAPEELVPPASKSNITGDFTGSGINITVSARHLRVNQMFRRIAADFGIPVIDAEYFWFKALEKYGEDALFNSGEYLHPNLLGHQQSYHAAIDMFIEGLQRQTSQSIEPQLFGNVGVNTQNPSAVLDIHVPYTTTPKDPLSIKARTGVSDGNGVLAEGVVARVDAATGDLILSSLSKVDSSKIDFFRVHGTVAGGIVGWSEITQTLYGGTLKRIFSGSLNVSDVQTIYDLSSLSSSGSGKLIVHGFQSGIGRKIYEVNFIVKSGVITLGTPATLGDNVFTIDTSGSILQLTAIASGTNFNFELEYMYWI